MARDTFATVTALIRQTCDDRDIAGGLVWPDTDLLAFVNAELLDLNVMLVNAASPITKKYSTHNIPIDATVIDFINLPDASNILPADLLVPYRIWEKPTSQPDTAYIDMKEQEEHLPDVIKNDRQRYWMWTSGLTNPGMAIQLLGANALTTLRLCYGAQLPAFAASDDPVLVPGATTVLAYGGLRRAALARGEEGLAAAVSQDYQAAYERIKQMHVKATQRRARRRAPYGGVAGYGMA